MNDSAVVAHSTQPSGSSASASSSSSQVLDAILSHSVDMRNNVTEQDRDTIFLMLRSKLENRICFDCLNRNPTWISITYAIFLCLNCSGRHRRYGTHVSFVRSTEMDKFTREQLIRMHIGGNGRARSFFREHGVVDGKHVEYFSKAAQKYKALLDKEMNAIINSEANPTNVTESGLLNSACPETIQTNLLDFGNDKKKSSKIESFSSCSMNTENNGSINLNSNKIDLLNSEISCTDINTNNKSMNNSASAYASNTNKSSTIMKAKKLDFDFDFDRIDESLFPVTGNFSNSNNKGPDLSESCTVHPTEKATPSSFSSSRFASAKAISSTQFFNDIKSNTNSSNSLSFLLSNDNRTSISSDELFGKRNKSSTLEEATGIKLENLKVSAQQRISAFAAASSEVVARARCWLNSSE